jgi:murein DD-endopeptidase MepM/ murein hydrolase activator NlpD
MIEIQIHPSDIRRKVRYVFLGRRRAAFLSVCATVLLGFMLLSALAAPSVIRRGYRATYAKVLASEREVQLERLREYQSQMSTLEKALDEQRSQIGKLVAVYGLQDDLIGKGGLEERGESAIAGPELELEAATRKEGDLRTALAALQVQLDLLADYEKENANLVRHIPAILPLPADQFVLTSPFGTRVSPFTRKSDFHKGMDFAAPAGTPIYATADGVVTFAGRYPLSRSAAWWRFGNVVVINHAGRFLTIYGHCNTVQVKRGQQVKQGDPIATVGSTGWSTNAHLHYEIRVDLSGGTDFQPFDPRIYILNHQWNNEEKELMRSRSTSEYRDLDPLPSAFIGRRRV